MRGTVLSLREKEFIESSRVLGNSELYTMWRHVLPNCIAPLTVLATSMFGWVILAESALSFLGLGAAARADLGQHAGRRKAVHGAGVLPVHLPGCPSRWRCWASTCWATRCGTVSIRA